MKTVGQAGVWIARFSSLISLFMLSAFIWGGEESNGFLDHKEMIGFLFFPVGLMIGLIIGWMHGWVGGVIGVVSLVAFYIWHSTVSGVFPSGPWFLIFSIPAFLFVLAGAFQKRWRKTSA